MTDRPAWRELEVRTDPDLDESVVAALDAAGAVGSWTVEPGRIRGYFGASRGPGDPGDPDDPGAPGDPPDAAFRRAWRALEPAAPLPALHLATVPPIDWTAEWRRAARPVAATAGLWVAPPDAEGAEPAAPGPPPWPADAVVVRIQPGAGFGTGGHATTRALLGWLDEWRAAGPVLDVGTGSGVLAIAAVLLGARRATGLDVDPDALANAAENRERNGVAERVALVAGSLDAVQPGARFERVLANLDAATLARLLPDLAARCAPDGRVGVAGLLAAERAGLLERAAACGLELLDERSESDPALGDVWWSAWLRPEPAATPGGPEADPGTRSTA